SSIHFYRNTLNTLQEVLKAFIIGVFKGNKTTFFLCLFFTNILLDINLNTIYVKYITI
ncbi:hypothetical protein BDU57DRAFT_444666, partial [Ampelomyces quisqualis]